MSDFKPLILDALAIMYKSVLADKQPFKARAYAKVSAQIKDLPHVYTYEDVSGVAGIGDKIRDKIQEILATGQLQAAERAKATHNLDATDAFLNIYGVGPSKAKQILDAGITSIAALRADFEKIRTGQKSVPKYYNDQTVLGLRYYEAFLERIPRQEMFAHQSLLATNMPPRFTFEIVGSFRRQAATSGDIDVLIRIPDAYPVKKVPETFKNFINVLKASGYITDILALGEKKCMAVCCVEPGQYRRIDLLLTPGSEYAYSILYFTGSDKFNIAFRQHALSKGYTLNEHEMKPDAVSATTANPVPHMRTEEDIFHFLGLKYIAPQDRVDGNQNIPLP